MWEDPHGQESGTGSSCLEVSSTPDGALRAGDAMPLGMSWPAPTLSGEIPE